VTRGSAAGSGSILSPTSGQAEQTGFLWSKIVISSGLGGLNLNGLSGSDDPAVYP